MASLTIGGVDISLARGDVPVEYVEVGGSRVRMDDGTMRELQGTRKATLGPLQTRLLTSAEEVTQSTPMIAAPPITCSGDILGGSGSYHVQLLGSDRVPTVSGLRYRLRFMLFQR